MFVGGTSTASAKFAVLNMAGNTPTASISANTTNNATYLTGTGNLATTNMQNLTIGGGSTGTLLFQPNGDTGDYLTLSSSGTDLTLATTDAANLTIDPEGAADIYFHGSTYNLSDTGDLTLGGRIIFENAGYIANESANLMELNEATIQLSASTDVNINTPIIDLTNQATNFDLINSNAAALTFESSLLRLDTTNTSVEVSGTTNLGGILTVNGNTIGLNSDGFQYNLLGVAAAGGAAGQSLYWGSQLICDPTQLNCGPTGYWVYDATNKALSPLNRTWDMFIGGTSTASAKFAILNMAGQTPPGSLSAQTTKNITNF